MEFMRQPYESAMSMPVGRRKRFIMEKDHLEQYRDSKRKK
jgi:hypothetical protein